MRTGAYVSGTVNVYSTRHTKEAIGAERKFHFHVESRTTTVPRRAAQGGPMKVK